MTDHKVAATKLVAEALALASKKLHEDVEQAIPDGARVKFEIGDFASPADWGTECTCASNKNRWEGHEESCDISELLAFDGKVAMVIGCDICDNEGQDNQYYSIKFDDGTEMDGVSGLSLKVVTGTPENE